MYGIELIFVKYLLLEQCASPWERSYSRWSPQGTRRGCEEDVTKEQDTWKIQGPLSDWRLRRAGTLGSEAVGAPVTEMVFAAVRAGVPLAACLERPAWRTWE